MILKHDDLLKAVQPFDTFVTAVIVEGCFLGTAPDTYLDNWLWNSDCRYAVLEVLKSEKEFEAPFIKVIGYKTIWGLN